MVCSEVTHVETSGMSPRGSTFPSRTTTRSRNEPRYKGVPPLPFYKRNLLVLSISIFLTACSWNQISPFLALYIESMDATANIARWSGLVFAAHFVSAFFAQPLWGKLGDRVGRKAMVMRAGFGLTVVYFGLSMSTQPWHLVGWRFANGILTGFIPGSITLIATNTPEDKAARAVAIAQSASAAGSMVGPVLGGILAGIFGYRLSLKASGIILLFSTLAVGLLVKEEKTEALAERSTIKEDLQIVFDSPVMRIVLITILLANILTLSVTPILTLYLRELSPMMSGAISGAIFSLPGIAFVLTAYRWSSLGERQGFDRPILAGLIGAGTAMALLALAPTIWWFGAGYFIYGLFAAALAPSAACLIATRVPEDFRGRAYGVQQSAGMLGGLIGPLAAGWVGDRFGLNYIFILTGIVALSGSFVLYHLFRRTRQITIEKKAKEPHQSMASN
jgi:DHA1 family multidrug resistance protein-like MFS transporter